MVSPLSFLIFVSSYLFLAALLAEGYYGMSWGRMSTQRMIPSMVVDVFLQNKIKEVKLYSASDNVIEAFGGTNISLAITMPNGELKNVNKSHYVSGWIDENVQKFLDMNVTFRYVYVGTLPLSPKFFNATFPNSVHALELMQKEIKARKLNVKATMGHYTDVLTPVRKPSEADFRADVKDSMLKICNILQKNNAPIGITIFPLISAMDLFDNDTEFGYFENNSTSKFQDGDYTYSNVFEVMYDTMVYALEKNGFPNMSIVVGEIGWPTDGIKDGTVQNAQRFHQGLAKFIASNKGTPKRPNQSIDAYIYNLADETAVGIRTAGAFFRHWGIYKFDGQPKFNLDFEGRERNVKPVSAIGITHMPKRWCVLDPKKLNGPVDYGELDLHYRKACNFSDCTAAMAGGSCSTLPFPLNISYGFNMGFQTSRQTVPGNTGCEYGGYGVIVEENPSMPNCTFPVEILAAEIPNYYGQRSNSGAASALTRQSSVPMIPILQFLLTMMFLLSVIN